MAINIETALPVVQFNGLNTAKPVNFASSPSVSLPAGTAFQGSQTFNSLVVSSGASVSGNLNVSNYISYNGFVTLASSATVSVNPALSNMFTYDVTAATSVVTSQVIPNQPLYMKFTQNVSGVSSAVTFGSNFKTTGALNTQAVAATKAWMMSFVSDGTSYFETARTTAAE